MHKRDLVICRNVDHRNIVFPFFRNPFWLTINSKIFVIENSFCKGFYNIEKIIASFPEVKIRFGAFHRIKIIPMKSFVDQWQYRNFPYTPILRQTPKKNLLGRQKYNVKYYDVS